jgi:protein-tyrosine phosphatase
MLALPTLWNRILPTEVSWCVKYAFAWFLIAGGCLWLASELGGYAWILLWPAISFLVVAFAYTKSWSGVFGKHPHSGRLAWPKKLLLAPFLLFTWFIWNLWRLTSSEPPVAQLSEECWIGRRPTRTEIPDAIRSVVDLTSEFEGYHPPNVSYLNIPILDGGTLSTRQFRAALATLEQLPKPIFVHCAQGHGRTAMVAIALLLSEKKAASVDSALKMIHHLRPQAIPNKDQLAALRALEKWLILESQS